MVACVIASLIFKGFAARIASAQVLYGSIVGTVTDQATPWSPRLLLSVKNTSTGLTRQAYHGRTGYYSIQNLSRATMIFR